MTVRSIPMASALALCLAGACSSDANTPSGAPAMAAGSQKPDSTQNKAKDNTSATAGMQSPSMPAQTNVMPTGSAPLAGRSGTSPPSMIAGSAGAGAPASAAGEAGSAGAPRAGGAAGMPAAGTNASASLNPETGTLPVPAALDAPGPFEILDVPDTGPGNEFRLFAPKALGTESMKYPIVAWSPGAGAFPDAYLTFLNLLASQGFVTLSYNSTAEGKNLVDAIDWLIAENDRPDSVLYGRLDTTKIAAGGHSAGSLATYEMADDPRLTTTLHMSGGSFDPATDVPKLHKPALMVCGDAGGDGLTTGDLANPMCIADFEMAKVPVFFAVVKGAGHAALNDADVTAGVGTAPDDPNKLRMMKAAIGWLRWLLAGDESLRPMFAGDDCGLCAADSGYIVKQKDLDQIP